MSLSPEICARFCWIAISILSLAEIRSGKSFSLTSIVAFGTKLEFEGISLITIWSLHVIILRGSDRLTSQTNSNS